MGEDVCPICFSSGMEVFEDQLVCLAFVHEEQEFQTGVDSGRFKRRLRLTKEESPKPAEEGPFLPVEQVISAYVTRLQLILQAQVLSLQIGLRLPKELSAVARSIWLRFVAQSGVLEEEFRAKRGLTDDSEADRLRRPMDVLQFALREAMPPDMVLAVCLLACHCLRSTVLPRDFVCWTLSGQLPYFELLAGPLMGDDAEFSTHLQLLQGYGVMGADQLQIEACRLANRLSLKLPPANAACILQRFVMELDLPMVLLPSALRLHDLHVASWDKAHMSSYVESDAACNLMAALIVAVKVAYGLCFEAVLPPPGFPARLHWGTWALGCLRRHQSPLEEARSSKVLALDGANFQRFMRGMRATFRGSSVLDDFGDTYNLLAQVGRGEPHATTEHTADANDKNSDGDEPMPKAAPDPARMPASRPYLMYGKVKGRIMMSVHPDYASLLTASAAFLWLKPNVLHEAVCALEVVIAEAEVQAHLL